MCLLSSDRAIFNFPYYFVNIMSFGLAPAALTQSAHNTPISKYYTKYSLYDAPRTRGRWIASSSLTYYTLQILLGKDIIGTPLSSAHLCLSLLIVLAAEGGANQFQSQRVTLSYKWN